ncbi:MAG: hypothetical protein Q4G64_03225 [bacterium]|nr:hypothetical protein [bacterium]
MRRPLLFLLLLGGLFLLAYTPPTLRTLQGPFVTEADAPGPASTSQYTAQILPPVVATGHIQVASGDELVAPEGETILVVHLRAAALEVPVEGIHASLAIGSTHYAAGSFTMPQDTLSPSTLQPGMWLEGSVAFRMAEPDLREAQEVRLLLQTWVDEQFADQLSLRIPTEEIEWQDSHQMPAVGYGGLTG